MMVRNESWATPLFSVSGGGLRHHARQGGGELRRDVEAPHPTVWGAADFFRIAQKASVSATLANRPLELEYFLIVPIVVSVTVSVYSTLDKAP